MPERLAEICGGGADVEALKEERQRVAQLEEELKVVKEYAHQSAAELSEARTQLQPLWVRPKHLKDRLNLPRQVPPRQCYFQNLTGKNVSMIGKS